MRQRSDQPEDWEELRDRIVGLGEHSARKSYYPELREQVHELEEARKSLASLNSFLQAVMDSSTEVAVIATTPEGTITLFNRGAERLLGYRADEVVGTATPLLFHLDEEVARYAEELSTAYGISISGFRTFVEHATRNESEKGEWIYVHKDGHHIPVELVITAIHENDRITGFLGMASDISERKQAEEQLRLSEQKYASIFQLMPDMVGITRMADGTLIEVNTGFERWTGWTKDEVIGRTSLEIGLWEPEVRDRAVSTVKEQGRVENFEFSLGIKSGEKRHAVMYLTPILVRGEECLYFIARDITQDRQSAQNLSNERTRLQTLLQTIPDLVWLKDADGVYLFCNARFERFFGAAEAEIVGKTDYDFVSRELADLFREHDKKAIDAGIPSVNEELVIFADDGHEELLETIKTPMRDEQGTLIGVLGIARNITSIRQAEANLMVSEQRYRQLFEQNPAPMLIYERGTLQMLAVNESFLRHYGYSADEALLLRLPDLYPPEEKSRISEVAAQLNGHANVGEWHHCRKDGSLLTIVATSHDIAYQGRTARIAVITDITERKQLEEQLRQSQKMESIGRLAGGVAHDFNNMLTVIMSGAELARSRSASGDPVQKYLDMIAKAADRSSSIIRQLLAFSRKELISPRPVQLNDLISESHKLLARLITEDITLTFRAADNLWTVKIDPSQVDQLLMNLVVNARDAMPDGGNLLLETENVLVDDDCCRMNLDARPGNYVQLTVSDTGCGMDRETLSHIFEPFFTTKEIGKGTGLGLATVYGIVTQNEGFINVQSEPNQGTTFRVYLPQFGVDSMPEQEAAHDQATGSGTILLVEDEEMLLWTITQLLEMMGYTVIQAATPGAAIEVCSQSDTRIDLILTDVVMPEMNGKEMADQIKQVRPSIKVLFMSGYSADIVAQRGIVEQGMQYVQKPLEAAQLRQKLHEILSG